MAFFYRLCGQNVINAGVHDKTLGKSRHLSLVKERCPKIDEGARWLFPDETGIMSRWY